MADHLSLRRDTIGVQPTLDLAERVGHYEVPDAIFTSDLLTQLRRIAAEVDSLHNDICSFEKERDIDDTHNIVLILQDLRGCDVDTAVHEAAEMLAARTRRFGLLETRIPHLCDRYGLPGQDRDVLHRYLDDALRTVMRGDYDWAENSGRYA